MQMKIAKHARGSTAGTDFSLAMHNTTQSVIADKTGLLTTIEMDDPDESYMMSSKLPGSRRS